MNADEIAYLKAEEKRQAQIFAEAMQAAITAAGKTLEMPMMNALAGALVTVEAGMLASVADHRARKALKEAMKRARPRARAEAETRKQSISTVEITLSER